MAKEKLLFEERLVWWEDWNEVRVSLHRISSRRTPVLDCVYLMHSSVMVNGGNVVYKLAVLDGAYTDAGAIRVAIATFDAYVSAHPEKLMEEAV